jgi:acetoin utilization deacetylase AcuC-like enzyme
LVEPPPATEEDLLLVHHPDHLARVRQRGLIYELALLAAGGAIKAAELAMAGEPTFALIRPPGHHAGPHSCWGFCWFNNLAVAVERLRRQGLAREVLIIDFGLHYGDGTANTFAGVTGITYHHLTGRRLKALGLPVFAVLEGGYNHRVLGANVKAFLDGLA